MTFCFALTVVILSLFALMPVASAKPTQVTTPVGEPDLPEETEELLYSVEVPLADLPRIAERLSDVSNVPDIVREGAPELDLGAREDFWVTNVGSNETRMVNAELVFKSEHVYFWVEEGVYYDLGDVQRVVEGFEMVTYPEVRALIGEEWSPGVDGDPHLYVLYAGGIGNSVAGLFFSKDEYSSLAQEYSNEHEMFYLNADNVNLRGGYADNLLAHEFQHLVHWNLDRDEVSWVNEGLSELVEFLLGYEVGGFDILFSQNTDIPLLHWPSQPGSTAEHYGQTFLYMVYIYERFGADAIKLIANSTANGLRSIEEMLEEEQAIHPSTGDLLEVEDIFLDWAVSLVLQDPTFSEGQYGLLSYPAAPTAEFSETISDCPTTHQDQVFQYGIDFILIDCPGEFELHFSGQLYAQVVSANPRAGNFVFWSNMGDSSDMTLTRSFDFRDVEAPILFEYSTWFWIEKDYDYVYLEISTDHGETWQIVETPSGTNDDPSGNSYGWAYNGMSGNEDEPRWINEQVDLSRFAGQEVLIRFEYITDTAVNTEGFLLDNLKIEAIGYVEDFELSDGGWIPLGFTRIHNLIPQTYKLAIIERGSGVSVRDVSLDGNNEALIPVRIGGEVDQVILVVTGTSQYSWLPTRYVIEISE